MTLVVEQTAQATPEQIRSDIAAGTPLTLNDDGTYTLREGGRTYLVEIKVHDVTEGS